MIISPSYPPQAVDSFDYITEVALDITGLLAKAHHPKAGAVVLFSGEVRDHNQGKEVAWLHYEAHHAIASRMIAEIIADATIRWNLTIAIAQHRIGRVDIGESAVVVITAAVHRKAAYMASQYIIDKIKHEVPVWKCEYFTDGTKQWGNNCNCAATTGTVDQHVYNTFE